MNPMSRRVWGKVAAGWLVLAAVMITLCAAPGWPYRHTRPHVSKDLPRDTFGMPRRDYQYHHYSPTVTLMSLAATSLPEVEVVPRVVDSLTEQPRRVKTKLFQFIPTSMGIDHCTMSRLAATIDSRGIWTLSFQADQNAQATRDQRFIPAVPDNLRDQVLQTSHLMRNLFLVKFRVLPTIPTRVTDTGIAATKAELNAEDSALDVTEGPRVVDRLGEPSLFQTSITPFWVQRGRPLTKRVTGQALELARVFDMIERVEIEFCYQYEAGWNPVQRP